MSQRDRSTVCVSGRWGDWFSNIGLISRSLCMNYLDKRFSNLLENIISSTLQILYLKKCHNAADQQCVCVWFSKIGVISLSTCINYLDKRCSNLLENIISSTLHILYLKNVATRQINSVCVCVREGGVVGSQILALSLCLPALFILIRDFPAYWKI